MSEPDPLNRLSRVANQPEQPALEFSDRLLEELLTQLVADQTGPTGPSFDHTINDKATEVIMLSPDRNEDSPRSRTWTMATAAGIAALALVGGLIVIGTRADEDQLPADQPPQSVPAEPATTVESTAEEQSNVGAEVVDPALSGDRLVSGSECGDGVASTNGLYEYAPVGGEMLRLDLTTNEITSHGPTVDECAFWLGDETVDRRVAVSQEGDRVWFGPFEAPWDTEIETGGTWGLLSTSFSGNRLVFFDYDAENEVVVDATTGGRVSEQGAGELLPVSDRLFSDRDGSFAIAANGDGSLLAIGGSELDGSVGQLFVIDAANGDRLFEVKLPSAATSAVFDDVREELIVGSLDGELVTVDLASGEIVSEVSNASRRKIQAVGIRNDGLVIAVNSRLIELFDRVTGPTGTEIAPPKPITVGRIRPDGSVTTFTEDLFEVYEIDK